MGKEIWIKNENVSELDKLMKLGNFKSYNEVISYLICGDIYERKGICP